VVALGHNEETEETYAAVLLNAEFALTKLWANSQLRFNPFLKHWVDAVQRCEPLIQLAFTRHDVPLSKWWALVQTARMELIKGALGIQVCLLLLVLV
jgi:hypothetical protein